MTMLILGLILWIGAHFFKRLMPQVRARMGEKGKGPLALAMLLGLVLMVIGYRSTINQPVFTPIAGMGHLNNLLMLVAVFLLGAGAVKGRVAAMIRHPMLWGAVVWSIAHLLVNGDLSSLVLFGGIAFWALGQMFLINQAEGRWDRPAPGPWSKDAKNMVITLVIFGIIAGIHIWLGFNPFKGTYG